jgi:hypothetical protein
MFPPGVGVQQPRNNATMGLLCDEGMIDRQTAKHTHSLQILWATGQDDHTTEE